MALSPEMQLRYWVIAAVVLAALLWALSPALAPFLTGAAIAYFLNPLVGRLMGLGLPRPLAVTVLMLAFLGAIATALLLIVPAVVGQAVQFTQTAPELFADLYTSLTRRFAQVARLEDTLQASLANFGDALRERGAMLAEGVWRSVAGLVSVIVFLIITPVVAFYLMLDWPRVVAGADDLLPRAHAPTIRHLAQDIDRTIAGFVRGQLTVCLILAAYYATALGLVGLQFGLVIGVVAGLISFIPYIGAIIGGALAIGVALWQFWGMPASIGLVVVIFAIGQLLEGNFLVPRIVGNSVRLHPVWLLFAVSVFGMLFGFTGMLIAVPVAASVGVLVRFGLARYRDSALYGPPPAQEHEP